MWTIGAEDEGGASSAPLRCTPMALCAGGVRCPVCDRPGGRNSEPNFASRRADGSVRPRCTRCVLPELARTTELHCLSPSPLRRALVALCPKCVGCMAGTDGWGSRPYAASRRADGIVFKVYEGV